MGVSNQPGVQHPQTPAGVNDPTSIDFVGDPTTDPGHKHTAASAPGTAPPLPASTVIGPDVFGASPAVGTDDTFAREDHDHGLPNTAMTQSIGDNSTLIATDAFVQTAVNNAIAGVNPAVAVLVATTASGDTSALIYSNGAGGVGATLTGSVNTPISIDGVLLNTLGQRLLVKNDTQSPSGAFNGIYYLTIVSSSGTAPVFTRAADYNTPTEINNTGAIPVQSGTANADTSWLLTSQVATVGTSPLTYVQFTLNPTTIMTKSTYDPAAIAQQVVGTTATQTLTNKTLTAPVISSIVNTGTLTLPTASDTLTGRATTDTLTNKRVTYRVYAYSGPGATPTIDTDTYDVVNMTALAANITSMTTNLTGTPNPFDRLILGFTDNGTARTIAWGTGFEASTVALPLTTVVSTLLLVGLLYNPTTSKYRCVAVA